MSDCSVAYFNKNYPFPPQIVDGVHKYFNFLKNYFDIILSHFMI